jgi:predicted ATPase/DNA-binding winged helix-turn-helix (wHTH) protein
VGTTYEIGPFRLDPAVGVLTQDGVPQPLGARGVAVLAVLVERANQYVSKAAMIDAVWPGLVVEESNLAVQVSAIRRVLAQASGGDRWIETLARRGYRFVGPVTEARTPKRERLSAERSNLPEPLTSFVGRERELVEIKRLLSDSRLLTLVGAGGIGKTRLALQAAAEVVDAYRDGVRFVDFAALRDGALVATTIAQALGVLETAGSALVASLAGHLRRRQLLLLLDNCEHVRSDCTALSAALLQAASGLTIVATSREPLQMAGERIYALSPLSLPQADADAAAIDRSEAVQLFVERAGRQQHGFTLTPARAPVVAELCRHLDGIPLALELAAARVRSLSVEQILARIGDRFRLLATGAAAAVPRHQTLRATLDWSFDLLAEDERTVLRRIAVFAGGFTLDAAAAVAADAALDGYAIVDVLARLVARSLICTDTSKSGVRYQLLETMRAYALERLAEAGEAEPFARAHARHVRDVFERAAADWWRCSDAEWDRRYWPELDNVRAALSWALGSGGDAEIGIALAAAAGPLWTELALIREGRRWIDAAAARITPDTPEADLARLWRAQGVLLEAAPPQALPACERAVALYRRLADAQELGLALMQLAATFTYAGQFEPAAAHFAEALPLLERGASPKALGTFFLHYGAMQTLRGEPAAACAHYEKALSLFRRAGAERLALLALMYVADMTWTTSDLAAALAAFRETVTLARRSPLRRLELGYCLTNLAGVHLERGEQEEALASAREGIPLLCEDGQLWLLADHVALLAARAGQTVAAAQLAGYADASHAAKAAARQANEARARKRLRGLLMKRLSADDLARYLAEGASLDEDGAGTLALAL